MTRIFGQKKSKIISFSKAFVLSAHTPACGTIFNSCSSLEAPRSSLPEQSCWGMWCSAALTLQGGCPAAGTPGSSSTGVTESPEFWQAPHHSPALLGFAMSNFNRAGCFWGTVNEPTFITVILQDDWSVTSQAMPAKDSECRSGRSIQRSQRGKSCATPSYEPIWQDHGINPNTSFTLTESTPGLLFSRETNQAFLYGNILLLCLLKTLKSHILISYSMQACEPLHLDVEGKIYPWHKNQSH